MKDYGIRARRSGKQLMLAQSIRPGFTVMSASIDSAIDLLNLVREVQGDAVTRKVRVLVSTGMGNSVRVLPTARRR
jgi:hypothetical protein